MKSYAIFVPPPFFCIIYAPRALPNLPYQFPRFNFLTHVRFTAYATRPSASTRAQFAHYVHPRFVSLRRAPPSLHSLFERSTSSCHQQRAPLTPEELPLVTSSIYPSARCASLQKQHGARVCLTAQTALALPRIESSTGRFARPSRSRCRTLRVASQEVRRARLHSALLPTFSSSLLCIQRDFTTDAPICLECAPVFYASHQLGGAHRWLRCIPCATALSR